MKRLKILLYLTITLLITINLASAYEVKHTLKNLVSTSPLVIIGQVSDISSKIENTGKKELVYTYVEVTIDEIVKGSFDGKSITIKMTGGKVDELVVWTSELKPFSQDEEVLLFLHPEDQTANIWIIPSISGKLSISGESGDKLVETSMLKSDIISTYGPNTFSEYDDIISRIDAILNNEEE